RLPPYRCDLPALEFFIARLLADLPSERKSAKITAKLRGQTLESETVEELRQVPDLPSVLNRITVDLHGFQDEGGSYFIEFGPSFAGSGATVIATGPSAAWCAGAVEEVTSFAREHKNWYWFLRAW